LSGRSGSGKTELAGWLLSHSLQHWVIFNPKHTAGYKKLPDANVLQGFDARKVAKSLEAHRFTIINFTGAESTPAFMDSVIEWLHESYTNIGLCCDELYTLHTNGRPGPGLIGWLTRGRELKQSFIGLTQRPAWVSVFLYSEANYIVGMDLTMKDDRKRLFETTGEAGFLKRLDAYYWRWYDVSNDSASFWAPVPLTNVKEGAQNG
jgi:hypothetical protein